MEIQTKKIEKKQEVQYSSLFKGKIVSIHDQLMSCRCKHPYYSHILCVGKCDYPYCNCEGFIQGCVEVWDYSENYVKIENNDRKYEGGLF